MIHLTKIPENIRKIILENVKADSFAKSRVVIENNDRAPCIDGDYGHFETRGGAYIYHPHAYARKGWSNIVYVKSTRCIHVGVKYLLARMTQKDKENLLLQIHDCQKVIEPLIKEMNTGVLITQENN